MKRLAEWRLRRRERGLVYCQKRCPCGALYAYEPGDDKRAWDCSDILLGLAIPSGETGAVTHGDTMPFVFWKVREARRSWALEHRQA
jgi:hypothetical protein